jgi:hypothetical protein
LTITGSTHDRIFFKSSDPLLDLLEIEIEIEIEIEKERSKEWKSCMKDVVGLMYIPKVWFAGS